MPKLGAPNLAEGVVIKPVKSFYVTTMNGKKTRAIVKKKIEQFSEEMVVQESKHKEAVSNDKSKSDILNLVTKNRLNNVISKIGKVTGTKAQRTQLVQLLVKDVFESYAEKHSDKKIDAKALAEEVEKKAKIIVDEYF